MNILSRFFRSEDKAGSRKEPTAAAAPKVRADLSRLGTGSLLKPQEGDFQTAFPKYLVICTELPASSLAGDEGKQWTLANRNVVVGTFLGITSRPAIEAHMARMEAAGLNMFVCCDCSSDDITSGMADLEALKLISIAEKVSVQELNYRPVVILQKDIFNKAGLVRYCWYF